MAGFRLNFAPGRANVKLLAEGKFDEVLDRLRYVVGLDFFRAHVRGDVGDESLAVVGHDVVGGSRGHHDVVGGDHGVGWILRERALIEAVGYGWAGTKIVIAPVVGGDDSVGAADSGFCRRGESNTVAQEISTLHCMSPGGSGSSGSRE